jgi:hypothetical protein
VNPTQNDLAKLSDNDLRKEMDAMMKRMGYGHQPYFVYKHQDVERTHFHIVSTRIDVDTHKKINDSNEKRKIDQFVKDLQQKYNLDTVQNKSEVINLIPNTKSINLMDSVQEVFTLLNRSSISSKQEYLDILKAFNLEIYQSKNGQSVLIKDQDGNTLRHPINMSDFTERADVELTLSNKSQPDSVTQQVLQDKTKQVLQGLIKEYRFFTAHELRKVFLRNGLIPYRVSKNGNYNIYSPTDKTVVDAQFLIKKYSVRLKNFALSNDQFHAIIKDYTERLLSEHRNIAEALVDTKKSTLEDVNVKTKLVLKELDFSNCTEFNNVIADLNDKAIKELKKAMHSHFEYLINQSHANTHYQQPTEKHQHQSMGYWEQLSRQFLYELMNNWRKGGYDEREKRRRSKRKKDVGRGKRF